MNQRTKIVAYTNSLKIEGEINFDEDSRLTDVLNSKNYNKEFLPINDAVVTYLKTGEITKVTFLSLNKSSIEVIYEEDN
jgi:DNA-dependent RNA polymerase auxiliary subunit epsilon